ncbi:MAG: GGDEF domain-containing protein [Rickettsia endosymbiont of Ixodes persulcatus]|nr:GGDEF domain-containing protein [Rickettsia endosymbiont of Ixodes persulcatus]
MSNVSGQHIGHQAIAMMDRLGVSPLPRNYNLCYQCISNSDQKLRVAVRALGNAPAQVDLDALIEKFLPDALGSSRMRRQQDDVLRNIEGVLTQLNLDKNEVATFTGAVDRVSESLSVQGDAGKITQEMVMQVAGALVEAGRRKVVAGNKTISNVEGKVDELGRLRDEIDRLRLMANTDELTRLFNRRAFDETLTSYYATEDRSSFALIMLDIDHFKKINDTYGHAGGDRVLRLVADCLKASMRQDTFVARTGGEEFAVILRKTSIGDVQRAAERIRASMDALEFTSKSPKARSLKVTVSVGACMADLCDTPMSLYDVTDAALYRSKSGGRNMVTISEGPDHTSSDRYQMYQKQEFR